MEAENEEVSRGFFHDEYLGDSVHARQDSWGRLVLGTEDDQGASNQIVFEPEVLLALLAYLRKVFEMGPPSA